MDASKTEGEMIEQRDSGEAGAPRAQRSFPWRAEEPARSRGARIVQAAAEPAGWKDALRPDFEAWLATVDQIPEMAGEEREDPDLYSFFEQVAIANTETRRANRRTAEAFSQWGDTLDRFNADLRFFREQLSRIEQSQPEPDSLPRSYCLALVEFLDRLHRLALAFADPPALRWWQRANRAWKQAWETQRDAFEILTGHLEALLEREGIARIDCLGRVFDPTIMAASAAGPDPQHEDNTVIEEFAPGYVRRGEVLRPAQVKVVNNRSERCQP
jgi:molecular chaperone GrpE (heat shock protein)